MKYVYISEAIRTLAGSQQIPSRQTRVEPVDEAEIAEAEAERGVRFSDKHKEFWLDVGHCLVKREHPLSNCGKEIDPSDLVMAPSVIVEMFGYNPGRFALGFPIAEISDLGFLVVRNNGSVGWEDTDEIIANDVDEFIRRYFSNARYFFDYYDDEDDCTE
jgi:hypothetical protein